MKKTKIVATMSDFRCTEEFVKQLFDAGMDVVRVNSAHVSEDGATHIVETVHRVNPAIPIMIDTKGPEIRVTTIADEYGNSINFRPGDRVAVRGSDGSDFTTRKVVYMNVPSIVSDIPVGARMLIADGELEIRVVGKNDTELDCEFVVGGAMRSRKSVNVPGVSIDLPSVTEKDRRFIEWAVKNDVDFIAHSFVRSARDIRAVQDILDAHGSNIKIISKIENQEGLDNIDEIIEASYGIMVARGDLGVELPAEVIPNTQRRIVEKCICAKRPVIIATQMLYSMVKSPRPTRAEVSDVASAIYERVDAVMLSDETAMGDFPVQSVETPHGPLSGGVPRPQDRDGRLLPAACAADSGPVVRRRADSPESGTLRQIPFPGRCAGVPRPVPQTRRRGPDGHRGRQFRSRRRCVVRRDRQRAEYPQA